MKIKFSNPIKAAYKAYRESTKQRENERVIWESEQRVTIQDYTDSGGNLHSALMVEGIPVKYLTKENIDATQRELKEIRDEYIRKRFQTR